MNDMEAWAARERTYMLWLELGAPILADAEEPDRGRRHMPSDADPRRIEDERHVALDEGRRST